MRVSPPIIEVRALGFSRVAQRRDINVIDRFDCLIHKGEFVSLVGPSGCGKSTLVALLSGAMTPNSGTIHFPYGKPKLGVQFQEDALFPWRRVWSNLGYPLEIEGHGKEACRNHAAKLCKLVELDPIEFLDRYPSELSGGERRRVSLSMALSASPELLLVDEATGSLDWLTRRNMQQMLQKLCVDRKLTTLAVTHDVEEAVWLSDRVLVMQHGGHTKEFAIDLSRPRSDTTRKDSAFIDYVEQVAAEMSATKEGIVPR